MVKLDSLKEYENMLLICQESRCGSCREDCPVYKQFRQESLSFRGKSSIAQALLDRTIGVTDRLIDMFYLCTTCGQCRERCPNNRLFGRILVDNVAIIVAARCDIIENNLAPKRVKDFLNNIGKYGNPWGIARSKRDLWAKGISHRYISGDEYLFHVGCVGSYEERGQRMARSFAEVLQQAKVSFGFLGVEENCDGNEAYMLGEIGLFEELAKKNIQVFKELKVKKIVTLSPHAYNSMKNMYPRLGGDFEVLHYTHLLLEIIRHKKIELSELKAKVTYHDPCFLGRYNGVYDVPREIIRSIPGVQMIEMERNKESALCCGGGSGNFVMDLLGPSKESPSRIIVREAYEIGAEILAVACPICMMMLDDAVRDEGLNGKLTVKDISELVRDLLKKGIKPN